MNLLALAVLAVTLTIAPAVVAGIVGTVLPAVVAFISHADAPAALKRCLGGLVAVIAAVITNATMADGTAAVSLHVAVLAVLAFLLEQASYLGLWQHLNLNRWRWLLPAIGLGKPPIDNSQ